MEDNDFEILLIDGTFYLILNMFNMFKSWYLSYPKHV